MEYGTLPEITLKYKRGDIETIKVKSSQDIYDLLKKVYDADTIEYFESSIVIFLNNQNLTLGFMKISMGGMTGTVMDPRVIFSTALGCGATAIILSHNHPSGTLNPSDTDIKMTRKLRDCGQLLEIKVLDHIIVTNDGFYSFSDEGMI